jgi:hypothetical protein
MKIITESDVSTAERIENLVSLLDNKYQKCANKLTLHIYNKLENIYNLIKDEKEIYYIENKIITRCYNNNKWIVLFEFNISNLISLVYTLYHELYHSYQFKTGLTYIKYWERPTYFEDKANNFAYDNIVKNKKAIEEIFNTELNFDGILDDNKKLIKY